MLKCTLGELDVIHVLILAGDCGSKIIVVVNENIIQTTVNYKAGETFYFAGKQNLLRCYSSKKLQIGFMNILFFFLYA